jgi:hypothetical protein
MSTITDTIRREWYLLRFSWDMQDYPQRAYRRIKSDLRRDLTVAAQDVGLRQAIADLGHPRVLAERYAAELDRPRPRWATGATAAALAVGFLVYLGLAYALGANDVLEAMGGGSVTVHPLGAEATFTSTAEEISLHYTPTVAGQVFVLCVGLVSFLLGARVWRVLP